MFMTLCEHIAGKEFIMADEKTVINVDLNMFGQDAAAKTAAYVPDAAITMNPYWDAHKEFMNLPEDVQTAFAIRMLFTHRPVDRYGADMFLHYHRGFQVNFVGSGANKY